ncbi:MAG: phenylacetate--CoA ligase [Thermoplasmata archaeon]|nr:MAG: phenylacetate--CoA ligase [Thermoplasmata archaeon]RLF33763.1 MAG: phenylacetate--CoA ligase [Thermoplasmata archaeon]RLF37107.1 MAG: phenylacetate--CoA ligase [Thermoplasmata archaeon]
MDFIFNEKIEKMSRKKIRELQLKRLKETVHRVFDNVPFYQKKFKELKITPGDIKTLDDIRKLPFTTKNDLRDNAPFGMMATPLENCIELHASSGTTGTPVTVCYTPHDINVWSEVMARCLSMSGLTREDVFQNPIPYGTFTGAFGFHYGAQKIGALVIPSGMGQSERQIKLMEYYGTTFISGVASYAIRLSQVALDIGVDPKKLKVRNGLFGAEMFTQGLKKRLRDIWDMDVHDIYGLTEMCGPGVSTDCDQHDGLHLWEDHFLVEVVDPVTLEPVELEEEGEIVLTTLTKEGMPLLRYRTRDITRLYDEKTCECGRTHVKHTPIKGRSDDMLIIRGTNIYPGQIESVLMKHENVGGNWRMILSTENDVDQLTVEVESKKILNQVDQIELEETLKREIKSVIVFTPKVTVLPPNSITQEGLKAKRVIDNRKKE